MKKIIGQYQAGELEAMPGRSMAEAFENRVNAVLNKARDDAGKKAQNSLTLHVSELGGLPAWGLDKSGQGINKSGRGRQKRTWYG